MAARQLNLNPMLSPPPTPRAASWARLISPQNIATGVSVTKLKGQEGAVFARTFIHSVVLTLLLVMLVLMQQYLIPWVIPAAGAGP